MKKTLENLAKAFAGESQARNRYTFYAKVAQKEGFEQIGAIFLETAEQEKTHAKRLFEHIQELKAELEKMGEQVDLELKIEAGVPTVYDSTATNLQAAIDGEKYEYEEMYPEFAKIAEEEGLSEIAMRLKSIAIAEKHHQDRYQKLLDQIKAGTFFEKDGEVVWVCRECGYLHKGKTPPTVCPACSHPQAFYQLQQENY